MEGFVMLVIGLVVGLIVGSALTFFLWHRESAYGYFVLEPVKDPDDPELHTVGIKLLDPVEGKHRIILTKKESQ